MNNLIPLKNEVYQKTENIISSLDFWNNIPKEVKELLFFTEEDVPQDIDSMQIGFELSYNLNSPDGYNFNELKLGTRNDPSTIYFPLPIEIVNNLGLIPEPIRYPKYYKLSSQQRYKYLHWLSNINTDVEIGYVHLFMVGLERQLILGNFRKSFDMLLKLQNLSKSKQLYVLRFDIAKTLFTACLINHDYFRYMDFTYEFDFWDDLQLLIKFFNKEPIYPEECIKILNKTDTKNTRYFSVSTDVYISELSNLMIELFGTPYILPQKFITAERLEKSNFMIGFHNSSFPSALRNPQVELPSTRCLIDKLKEIHLICHERTKKSIRNGKKKIP